ncbi:ribbon-helix-helix domain-containing protein [Maricaulis sp.]|uniref:ribbon-helix-helix domain-containing protein n=1 Tax=Maricaulis sp. TaxID=1486257 RepID=UPI002B26F303|nr:ribbon-helix-helix domain-containing protein [Maricaulis sp.]
MPLYKRSLSLAGHRTSISLEPEFWAELDRLAILQGRSLASLVGAIDAAREDEPLASSVRVWILQALRHEIDDA